MVEVVVEDVDVDMVVEVDIAPPMPPIPPMPDVVEASDDETLEDTSVEEDEASPDEDDEASPDEEVDVGDPVVEVGVPVDALDVVDFAPPVPELVTL